MVRIVPDAAERVVRLRAARAVASARPPEAAEVGTAEARRATGRPGPNGAAVTAPAASAVVVTDRAATARAASAVVATARAASAVVATDRAVSAAV